MLVEIHNNEILFSKKSGYKTGEVFDFIDYARKTRYPDRRLAQFHNLEIKNVSLIDDEIITFDFSQWISCKENMSESEVEKMIKMANETICKF